VIVEEQGFRAALAFVVARAQADRVHMAPVPFGLRVHGGIAVYLARRGLKNSHAQPLCEAKHVDCAVHAGLDRLHGIMLIVDRACRTGEIENLVDLDVQREADIVTQDFEAGIGEQMRDIAAGAREKIVGADDLVSRSEQDLAKMAADESCAAGDENSFHVQSMTRIVRKQGAIAASVWPGR